MLRRLFILIALVSGISAMAGAANSQEKETDDAIVALSKDPIFRKTYKGFFKIVDAIDTGITKLPEKERKELVRDLKRLMEVRGTPDSGVAIELRKRIFTMSGVMLEDLERISTLGKDLVIRHPILSTGPAAAGQAAQIALMEYSFHTIDPEALCDATCTCLNDCTEERRVALNDAGLSAFADLFASPSLFNIFQAFIGIPVQAAEIYEAELECEQSCTDFGPGFNCQSDDDCETGEFCQNPIGNPVNRCEAKRPLGRACSADRKCESGCCKFHFWTNPVQMVCRPADKCN